MHLRAEFKNNKNKLKCYQNFKTKKNKKICVNNF